MITFCFPKSGDTILSSCLANLEREFEAANYLFLGIFDKNFQNSIGSTIRKHLDQSKCGACKISLCGYRSPIRAGTSWIPIERNTRRLDRQGPFVNLGQQKHLQI